MDVRLPDGVVIRGVPDGTTRDQLAQRLQANGRDVPADWLPPQKPTESSRGSPAKELATQQRSDPATYDPETGARIPLSTLNARFKGAEVAMGLPEVALSGATGGAGVLADVATGADPGTHDWAYRPRTEPGQAASQQLASMLGPVASGVSKGYDKAFGTGPLAMTVKERGNQAAQTIGALLGGTGAARSLMGAGSDALNASKLANFAEKPEAIQNAQALGYRLQPSQIVNGEPIGGVGARAVERMAGKAALPAELSIKNAPLTQRLVAEDLGISPAEHITPAVISDLRTKANQAYETLEKNQQRIAPDEKLYADLQKISAANRSEMRGEIASPKVEDLVNQYQRARQGLDSSLLVGQEKGFRVGSVMKEVRQLRFESRKNFLSEDPKTVELGRAQKKISDSLENMIDRQLEGVSPEAVQNWRAARQQLARLHLVEDSLKGTEIDPKVFAKALSDGEPLTGNMRKIAEVAGNFPQVMQAGANLGSKSGVGLLDMALAVPTLGAWPMARYGSMKLATRKPWEPNARALADLLRRNPAQSAGE